MDKADPIFKTINETAKMTGLSRTYIRTGCKNGSIPCIRLGSGTNAVYKIHVAQFCEMLEKQAAGISE